MTTTTPERLINAANCGNHCSPDEIKALAKSLVRELPTSLIIITTAYTGGIITARINDTRGSKRVSYDHGMGPLDNHAYAALYLLSAWFEGESLQYQGHDDSEDGRGYCFTFRFV